MHPSDESFRIADGVLDIWNHLATIEEMFYKQKSCVKWLEVEDMNTPFFHQEVQSRNARNAIKSLLSSSREVLTNASAIKKETVDHFQRFLQTQPDTSSVSLEEVQELLSYRCSDSKALDLVSPITATEIIGTLQALPNGKVSGPNGFTKEFFVAAWPVFRADFFIAVQSFFLFGFMPVVVNVTILSLIPKT